MNKERYSVAMLWSEEECAYLACVPELPGCMADGRTREEALKNLEEAVVEWIEMARHLGRDVPAPVSDEAYQARAEAEISEAQRNLRVALGNFLRREVGPVFGFHGHLGGRARFGELLEEPAQGSRR